MPINESLTSFFIDGVPATWTPSNGETAQTANVYIDAPDVINNIAGFDYQSGDRVITYSGADFDGIGEGESIVINSTTYRIIGEPLAVGDGEIKQARIGTYR